MLLMTVFFETSPKPDICCLRNRLISFKIGCFRKIIFNSSTLNSSIYRTISCLLKQIQVYLLGARGMYSFHIAYLTSHRTMIRSTVPSFEAIIFLNRSQNTAESTVLKSMKLLTILFNHGPADRRHVTKSVRSKYLIKLKILCERKTQRIVNKSAVITVKSRSPVLSSHLRDWFCPREMLGPSSGVRTVRVELCGTPF